MFGKPWLLDRRVSLAIAGPMVTPVSTVLFGSEGHALMSQAYPPPLAFPAGAAHPLDRPTPHGPARIDHVGAPRL